MHKPRAGQEHNMLTPEGKKIPTRGRGMSKKESLIDMRVFKSLTSQHAMFPVEMSHHFRRI